MWQKFSVSVACLALLLAGSLAAQDPPAVPVAPANPPPVQPALYEVVFEREPAVGYRYVKTAEYGFTEQTRASIGAETNAREAIYNFNVVGLLQIVAVTDGRVTASRMVISRCHYAEGSRSEQALQKGMPVDVSVDGGVYTVKVNGMLMDPATLDPKAKRLRRVLQIFSGVEATDGFTANAMFRPEAPVAMGDKWSMNIQAAQAQVAAQFQDAKIRRIAGSARLTETDKLFDQPMLKVEQRLDFELRGGHREGMQVISLKREVVNTAWVAADPSALMPYSNIGQMTTDFEGNLEHGAQSITLVTKEIVGIREHAVDPRMVPANPESPIAE